MTSVQATATASRSQVRWAGVRLSTFDRRGLVELLQRAVEERETLMVTFLNPFYARATAASSKLAETVDRFDVVQPDGWGVVYGARLARVRVPERVAIEDIERPLFDGLADRSTRVFLFGSAPGVAEAAAQVLRTNFPGISVVGTQHGWIDVEAGHPGRIDPQDAADVADAVRAAGSEVALVGLPTPLQQEWVDTYGPGLACAVVMTVGAYLDKLAEGLDWYPRWMERTRTGWLYRIYREPRRLTGRYTVGAASFLAVVVRAYFAAGRERDRSAHPADQ